MSIALVIMYIHFRQEKWGMTGMNGGLEKEADWTYRMSK